MSQVQNPNRRRVLQRLLTGAAGAAAVLGVAASTMAQPSSGTRPRNPNGAGGQRPPDGVHPHGGSRPQGPPSGGGQRPGGQGGGRPGGGQGPRGGGGRGPR